MFNKIRSAQYRLLRLVTLVGLTIVFLTATNPNHVSAIFLVVPFIAIFACLYLIALELIRFLQPADSGRGWAIYRPRLLAALLAAFPVLLLVLQSIMELNRWDVLIAFTIFLLAYIFVSRGFLPANR